MPLTPPVSAEDHILGNPSSSLELVEYGDFQCPHCGRAFPIVRGIHEKLGDRLKFVFRNFPLNKIHPQAKMAAVAAEAADLQGKFWEMHSILFENQRSLTQRSISEHAKSLGLDMDKFEADIQDAELGKKVDKSFMSGLRSGVNQTPSFFINGERYTGSWEEEDLLNYLEGLMK